MLDMRQLLTGPVQQMASVTRYSHRPVINRENVAEHSFFVILYAYAIGMDLRQRSYEVNLEKLFRRVIVHDLDESLTGDFVRDFKYSIPGLAKKIKEGTTHLFVKLLDSIGISRDAVYKDWEESKERDIEGCILVLCDFLAVVAYIYREIQMGNRLIIPIVHDVRRYLDEALYDTPEEYKRALEPYARTARELLNELAPEQKTLAVNNGLPDGNMMKSAVA